MNILIEIKFLLEKNIFFNGHHTLKVKMIQAKSYKTLTHKNLFKSTKNITIATYFSLFMYNTNP